MSFDRKGKCPICKKLFQSNECKHSWDYVHAVLQALANKEQFEKDIKKLSKRKQ